MCVIQVELSKVNVSCYSGQDFKMNSFECPNEIPSQSAFPCDVQFKRSSVKRRQSVEACLT